jgi:hypothetical protein
MAELVATFAGDPEGITSIEGVQWYRNDTPIPSSGTPDRSILTALEPGNYNFEAIYTDSQGYRTTLRSGRIEIEAAGSVPRQSRVVIGDLQTLWQLGNDGGVERFDSNSLRMRAVDTAGSPGYLAISASSDGRAWAIDNDGYPCLYDATVNRFLRQDGSGSDAGQRLNLGSGWRQIVATRGSSTAAALWLLGDAPLDGGSNVAYLPGALAEGQTLADLKPISLTGGLQLRLLAVGDDQPPPVRSRRRQLRGPAGRRPCRRQPRRSRRRAERQQRGSGHRRALRGRRRQTRLRGLRQLEPLRG